MLVDDSPVIRGMNARILKTSDQIEIVASVSNGELAVAEMDNTEMDVIVLDVEMPVMDGLTAIPLLREKNRKVKILMSSTLTQRGAEVSMQALKLGAADFVGKPTSGSSGESGPSIEDYRHDIVEKTLALGASALRAQARAARLSSSRGEPTPRAAKPVLAYDASQKAPRIIAIGSSTGGPQALLKVFKEIDRRVNCPILITQHMPPNFTDVLANHINGVSELICQEAKDGDLLVGGHIYVAPGDFHMTVKAEGLRHRISLNQEPHENFCRPAADPMFRSVAECFGNRVLCVVLTGMGKDGAAGAEKVAEAGGCVVAQDEETSVVWGMPGATYKAGVCSAVLPLSKVAEFINNAAKVNEHDT